MKSVSQTYMNTKSKKIVVKKATKTSQDKSNLIEELAQLGFNRDKLGKISTSNLSKKREKYLAGKIANDEMIDQTSSIIQHHASSVSGHFRLPAIYARVTQLNSPTHAKIVAACLDIIDPAPLMSTFYDCLLTTEEYNAAILEICKEVFDNFNYTKASYATIGDKKVLPVVDYTSKSIAYINKCMTETVDLMLLLIVDAPESLSHNNRDLCDMIIKYGDRIYDPTS